MAYVYQEADVIAFDCMADVIAMFSSIEQMLSPYLVYVYQEADVIAFYDYIGRCYCHVFIYIALPNMHITVVEADVICLVEDGISPFCESIMWENLYYRFALVHVNLNSGVKPAKLHAFGQACYVMLWCGSNNVEFFYKYDESI